MGNSENPRDALRALRRQKGEDPEGPRKKDINYPENVDLETALQAICEILKITREALNAALKGRQGLIPEAPYDVAPAKEENGVVLIRRYQKIGKERKDRAAFKVIKGEKGEVTAKKFIRIHKEAGGFPGKTTLGEGDANRVMLQYKQS